MKIDANGIATHRFIIGVILVIKVQIIEIKRQPKLQHIVGNIIDKGEATQINIISCGIKVGRAIIVKIILEGNQVGIVITFSINTIRQLTPHDIINMLKRIQIEIIIEQNKQMK